MKTLLLSFALTFSILSAFAQAPEKMNYQGVARDLSGNVLANQNIGLRITIHSTTAGGPTVYQETQAVTTNAFGLFDIKIGDGVVVSGTFSSITWGSDLFYVETEMDAAGGTNYQAMGTSQLVSVPYALYAKSSGSGPAGATGATGVAGATGVTGTAGATGPTGSFPSGTNTGDMQYWNGASWVMIPVGNPGQYLQVNSSNIPTWTGGGFATLTTNVIASQSYFSSYENASGVLISDGGVPVTGYGMAWNTSPNPTTSDNYSYAQANIGPGTFNSYVNNLAPNTVYYVRAYVITAAGISYGNQVSFTTFNPSVPTVTTTGISGITGGVANSGGNVSTDGGAFVSSRGVCWSTSPSPTIADSKTVNGSNTGSFTSIMNGLLTSTTYYVRAYATNIAGTGYGAQVSFTTTANLSIGGYHQGGLIGYFLQFGDPGYDINVLHGIIISQNDVATGVEWGCTGTLVSGASSSVIGGGAQNTTDIVTGCNTPGIAAELCNSLVLNSYSDWYLPTDVEWGAVNVNLILVNGISNTQGYWTSKQSDANNAFINFNNYPSYDSFYTAIQKDNINSYGGVVRAARMF